MIDICWLMETAMVISEKWSHVTALESTLPSLSQPDDEEIEPLDSPSSDHSGKPAAAAISCEVSDQSIT